MVGRPSDFTQEVADAICEKLAEGESLRSICYAEDMPACSTVFRWLSLDATFSEQYARARESQADALFDEILSIADEEKDDVQRSRLRVDARKWMAGKLRPKKYGERQEIEHSGSVELTTKEQRDAAVAAATRADR